MTSQIQETRQPIISVKNAYKYFKVRSMSGKPTYVKPVDNITLDVYPGEVVGLVGESGSGKSTLARVILKLITVDKGEIVVDGMDVKKLRGLKNIRKLRKAAQLVFQDPHDSMDPRSTIWQALSSVLQQHQLVPADKREEVVLQALEDVGLDESYLNRLPSECSGGQLQRVVIARALLLEPNVLVCDEPTSALDASVQAKVLNLIMKIREERHLTMLLVSHDLRVVQLMSDRIAVLYKGQLMELGATEQIMLHPAHPYTDSLIRNSGLTPAEGSTPIDVGQENESDGGAFQLTEMESDPGHFVRIWVPGAGRA